jgi:asparagine synthetase B (glutamine-hydrolysing)
MALSGDGGYEVFAGYNVYRSYALSEPVGRIPKLLRWLAVAGLRASRNFGGDQFKRLSLARNIEDAALPADKRFIAKQQTIFRREFLCGISKELAPEALPETDERLFKAMSAPGLDPWRHSSLATDRESSGRYAA